MCYDCYDHGWAVAISRLNHVAPESHEALVSRVFRVNLSSLMQDSFCKTVSP